MTLELRDYQEQRLLHHLEHERSALYLKPGRGKTPIACVYTKIMLDAFHFKSVWIQPVSLLAKNKDEILKWTGLKDEEVALLNVSKEKRAAIYKDKNVKVYLVGAATFSKEWQEFDEDVNSIVIDEVHSLYGTHSSARTQALYASSRRFKRFLFMTGTPVAGRYDTAYPTIALCEPRFYMNYRNFVNYHGVFDRFNHIQGWKNGSKLAEVLKRVSSGLSDPFEGKKDLKEFIFEKCNFDEVQKQSYLEMEEEGLLELEDKFIDTNGSGGVKAIRCRQILSCPEALGLSVETQGKDELLKLHLEEMKLNNEQIIIFSCFVAEQERIKKLCDSLGVKAAIMNGSTSSERRGQIDKAYREKKLDVIIGSPKVSSLGYNWEGSHSCIFTSLSYDNSEFEQSIARLDRGSRTRPLLVYILTYGTKVEKRVLDIIKRKSVELKKVLDE